MAECKKCIHSCVCKIAEACDGYVSGCKHFKEENKMNGGYVYYKEQCNFCINKGKCDCEKRTRTFVETIGGVERLANGVYGTLSFKCDYFDLDRLAYDKAIVSEAPKGE